MLRDAEQEDVELTLQALADVNSPILVIDHGEYPPYKSAQM